MSTETGPQADPNLITLRERMVRALLAPRYGGPQHNTPGGLPLTATPEQARRHRAEQTVDTVLAELPAAMAQHVARAIFALKSPLPAGSEHYRSGWDDGLEAAMDAARDAVLSLPAPPVRSAAIRKTLRGWAYSAGHIESELDGVVERMYELITRDVLRRMTPSPHPADHEPVWVTALDGEDQPALDADGKTWTHCGVCGTRRGVARDLAHTPAPAPAREICEFPHQTTEEEDDCERRRLAARPLPLATPCARPECDEHPLNWHNGLSGVCAARGGACPCDGFVPPAPKEQP